MISQIRTATAKIKEYKAKLNEEESLRRIGFNTDGSKQRVKQYQAELTKYHNLYKFFKRRYDELIEEKRHLQQRLKGIEESIDLLDYGQEMEASYHQSSIGMIKRRIADIDETLSR